MPVREGAQGAQPLGVGGLQSPTLRSALGAGRRPQAQRAAHRRMGVGGSNSPPSGGLDVELPGRFLKLLLCLGWHTVHPEHVASCHHNITKEMGVNQNITTPSSVPVVATTTGDSLSCIRKLHPISPCLVPLPTPLNPSKITTASP